MEVIVRKRKFKGNSHSTLDYWGADLHIEGKDFDKSSWVDFMDECVERKATVWMPGDIIGAIRPGDPRFTARAQLDRLNTDYWVNAVIDLVVDLFEPYVNIIGGMGIGNHEYEFIKRHGACPVQGVVHRLNDIRDKRLDPIAYMRICGFVVFQYEQEYKGTKGHTVKYVTYYHHGPSGNAPVTEGIIAAKRMGATVDGVDLFAMGHVHKKWAIENERFYLDHKMQIKVRPVRYICTGSHQWGYTEPGTDDLSYAELRGFPPAPMGGAFLKLTVRKYKGIEPRIEL